MIPKPIVLSGLVPLSIVLVVAIAPVTGAMVVKPMTVVPDRPSNAVTDEVVRNQVKQIGAPSGRVELKFVDECGRPLPDVVVKLLPPVVSGRPFGNEWPKYIPANANVWSKEGEAAQAKRQPDIPQVLRPKAVSGAVNAVIAKIGSVRSTGLDGVVCWEGLPSVPGYRYGVMSNHHITLNPIHENVSKRFLPYKNKGFTVNAGTAFDVPRKLSGMLSPWQDDSSPITVTVFVRTSITGRVISKPWYRNAPIVTINRVVRYANGRRALFNFIPEKFLFAANDGVFHLCGVKPGIKAMTVWWPGNQNEIFTIHRVFMMETGKEAVMKDLDVGSGAVRRGRLVFQADKKKVGLADYFGTAVPQVKLTVDRIDKKQFSGAFFFIDPDKPFTLHGLPDKLFSVRFALEFRQAGADNKKKMKPFKFEFPAKSDGLVDIVWDLVAEPGNTK